MTKNLKRKIQQLFRVDEKELDLIKQKMKCAGISNKEAYYRKMVLDGYIVRVDFKDVREMIRLLRIATNLLNQIAKKANASGNVHRSDMADIKENYETLWQQTEVILQKLVKL